MSRGSERVRRFLDERRIEAEVVVDESTQTSKMAADALGCSVAQIAKSIVFVNDGAAVGVISGDKRVDVGKLSHLLCHKMSIADASSVRKHTSYSIGGVPPFPHNEGVKVFLDCSLGRFQEVWTAAGTPNSVFGIKVETLRTILRLDFVDVSK